MHLGSQILTAAPYYEALERILSAVDWLREMGIEIRYVDMGGGLGIDYRKGARVLSPVHLSRKIRKLLQNKPFTLILEPGRSIVADSGALIARVLYVKRNKDKAFAVLDAGMNDFLRPALYDAFHRIVPVQLRKDTKVKMDIVGPVCETGDFFAVNRTTSRLQPGDLVAVLEAGAYGASMSSNYNSRPRAAEVLVDHHRHRLIRRRETFQDLIRNEKGFL
jgi:diaminopimelate decarboxylase